MTDNGIGGSSATWSCEDPGCGESDIADALDECPRCAASRVVSGRGGKREGAGRPQQRCVLDHKSDPDVRLDMIDAVLPRVIYIGKALHQLDESTNGWIPPGSDDDLLKMLLLEAKVCPRCCGGALFAGLRERLHRRSVGVQPNPRVFPYMTVDGVPMAVEFGSDGNDYRIRGIEVADYVVLEDLPVLDLTGVDEVEPFYVTFFMRDKWGLGDAEVEVFRAFVKSWMNRSHTHDEIMYIRSRSGTGKGTLYDLLCVLLGNYVHAAPSSSWNNFTAAGFLHKGLVVVNEAEFGRADWVALNGCTDTDYPIEAKYRGQISAKLDCKFLMLSTDTFGEMASRRGTARRMNLLKTEAMTYKKGKGDRRLKLRCKSADEVSRFARWALGGDVDLVGKPTDRMLRWFVDEISRADFYAAAAGFLLRHTGDASQTVQLSELRDRMREEFDIPEKRRIDLPRLRDLVEDEGFEVVRRSNKDQSVIAACLVSASDYKDAPSALAGVDPPRDAFDRGADEIAAGVVG